MINSHKLVEEYRKQIGRFTYLQMDCIKSITNILNRYGGGANVTGANWYARNEISNMRPLASKEQLYDGCAVLKTLLPGQEGYNLPPAYANHVNQIDYNHIGVGTDEGQILDSTRTASGRNGPGISTAPIGPNSWDIIGDFEDADYKGGAPQMPETSKKTAIIKAEKGSTVNLRTSPSLSSIVLEYLKVGETIEVLNNADGDWRNIRTLRGNAGWVMIKFLDFSDPVPSSGIPGGLTSQQIDALEQAIARIQEVLGNG